MKVFYSYDICSSFHFILIFCVHLLYGPLWNSVNGKVNCEFIENFQDTWDAVYVLEADVRIMSDEYELKVRLEDEIFVEMVAGLQVVGPAPTLHPAWRTHTFKILTALLMKGRWESNVNVWFPFMYSQKWNCAASFFPKQNYNVLSPYSYTQISVRDLYITLLQPNMGNI